MRRSAHSPLFENGAKREGRTDARERPGEIGWCAASAAQAVVRAPRADPCKHGRGVLKQETDTGRRQDE
jgi:hypothetical protein